MTRDDTANVWNALVYGVCFYVLGFGWLKAMLIMPLVLVCMTLAYGSRWLSRGGFALLVLTVLIWLDVVPPLDHWRDIGTATMQWTIHSASIPLIASAP